MSNNGIGENQQEFHCGRFILSFSKPLVMGILNLTPDSFSDGGRFEKVGDVMKSAELMVKNGADILDIGAESTRPGSNEINSETEWQRLKEILPLLYEMNIPISLDSKKPDIMRRALSSGIDMINDVSGFRSPDSLKVVEESFEKNIGFCIMHMQGIPENMQDCPRYVDVVAEVEHFLMDRFHYFTKIGVKKNNILIDPGLGFGKNSSHNFDLLMKLSRLKKIAPVLVGISRKRIIAEMSERDSLPNDRLGGSLGAALWAITQGVSVVRVHDVKETVDCIKVFSRLKSR